MINTSDRQHMQLSMIEKYSMSEMIPFERGIRTDKVWTWSAFAKVKFNTLPWRTRP